MTDDRERDDFIITEVPKDPNQKFLFVTQLLVSFGFETTVNTFEKDFCENLETTFLKHMAAFYEKRLSVGADGKIIVKDRGPEQKVIRRYVN